MVIPQRFELVRLLGETQGSRTMLVNDVLLERENVLLKLIRKGLPGNRDREIERFSWFTGLVHQNFAMIFDVGLTKQQHVYSVREYLPHFDSTQVDPFILAKSLVTAVDFLLIHGQVHGAIKPSNIFVVNESIKLADPKILGFKSANEEAIHFTAPEILRGGPITHEGDLYAVGCVLYMLLTGRHVFEDTDVARLKSKYLSASTQPVACVVPAAKSLFAFVLGLIDRTLSNRRGAFQHLKKAVSFKPTTATRAPFVGLRALTNDSLETIQKRSPALRVLSVEGELGIGKSRFVAELQLRANLCGVTFVTCACGDAQEWGTVLARFVRLIKSGVIPANRYQAPSTHGQGALLHRLINPNNLDQFSVQKVVNDLITVIRCIARGTRMVLAFEDANLAGEKLTALITQLAFRASELPITVLLTFRPADVPEWMQTIRSAIGAAFSRVCLSTLNDTDALALVKFLEADREHQDRILNESAGNPFLMHQYASHFTRQGEPPLVSALMPYFLSGLEGTPLAVLQAISIFCQPTHIDVLAEVCGKPASDLDPVIKFLLHRGAIIRCKDLIGIRFPAFRRKLLTSMPKSLRIALNRTVFYALKNRGEGLERQSHYAFEGKLLLDAGEIYRHLASAARVDGKYAISLSYYERFRECRKLCGLRLSPKELLGAAHCYDKVGNQRMSTRFYKELIDSQHAEHDPELLSTAFVRLAMIDGNMSIEGRAELLENAIKCLPENHTDIGRYAAACNALSRIGKFERASELLKKMDGYAFGKEKDSFLLNSSRATFFLHTGRFREAVEYYLSSLTPKSDQLGFLPGVLNNLALCFENLGDLKSALAYQTQARDLAIKNGDALAEIQSLDNIASIKMKCGDMSGAECLLREARTALKSVNTSMSVDGMTTALTLEADCALHATWVGDYDIASASIKKVQRLEGSIPYIDRIVCDLIRCRFFLAIGFPERVRTILHNLDRISVFRIDFFDVHRIILESQLSVGTPTDKILDLKHALALSKSLGTCYQQCELLILLSSTNLELQLPIEAESYAKEALDVANVNGYRHLEIRALLLSGKLAVRSNVKRHFLLDAYQFASEMGFQELVAEAAYHIGLVNLTSHNTATAREYLIRSTSITARLASKIPITRRAKYLAQAWRRDAVRALDCCSELLSTSPLSSNHEEDRYFGITYRFVMVAAAASSVETLVEAIVKSLIESIDRPAIIVVREGDLCYSRSTNLKLSTELSAQFDFVQTIAKNRAYFESNENNNREACGWIPLNSESCEGGIYVLCRSHEPQFTEKEIELLTMMGTIACSALRRLETQLAVETAPQDISEFHGIIGASKPMKELYSQIQMAAGNAATVLIEGESGTGKELVAKAIHAESPRAKFPIMPVDCGALPESLIEAELFGSKKGSYTGAFADKPGLFEAAHRGTIFLDEISNTSPAFQAKLLRVIQEREVRRIGELKGRPVDVRLIVASNQSLELLAESGQFRKDLLYRLRVLHIKVPALRNRLDDVPMLAHTFLQRLNKNNQVKKYFASGVVDRLCTQKFLGNVRELQNAIERAFFLTKGLMITDVPLHESGATVPSVDEVRVWFKDISEGRKDFWSAVQRRYKKRDISREKVVGLVDFGLRSTRGCYKTMASMFHLKGKDYRRFMDFLRRNECLLDFRPYRKLPPHP